jgi:hypothetical protein
VFDGTGNAYATQNDTNSFGNFASVYDDFKLGSSAKITSVDFTGEYFNPSQPGDITKFTLNIFADNAGQPGGLVYTTSVGANAGETFLGDYGGNPTFTYSMATSFNAVAGHQYWVSVVPDLGFPPQWGWASGTGGDGQAYQDFFGSRGQIANDLAFTLHGNAVPEPGTWALMILGFGMAGVALRRRATAAVA